MPPRTSGRPAMQAWWCGPARCVTKLERLQGLPIHQTSIACNQAFSIVSNQVVTLYTEGFIPGSCNEEPDGYTYLHIQ